VTSEPEPEGQTPEVMSELEKKKSFSIGKHLKVQKRKS
jgi:hypothetical protein